MHRKKYNAEFKVRVVEEAIETSNNSIVARRYDIAPVMVSRWVRRYKAEGPSAFDEKRQSVLLRSFLPQPLL